MALGTIDDLRVASEPLKYNDGEVVVNDSLYIKASEKLAPLLLLEPLRNCIHVLLPVRAPRTGQASPGERLRVG